MRKFILHFFFWIVFFLMWNQIMYFYVSNILNRIYFSALDVSLVVFTFYIIYFYIMPDYFRLKSISRLIGSSFILVMLLAGFYSWMMGVFLHYMLVPIRFDFSWNYKDLQYNRFFIALLGAMGGCFVKLAMDRLEVARRMEMIEREKSMAELNILKAQINPHFLFNSLNSLYTQLEHNQEAAKGTLVSLADLLRYQLYECNADFISIDKELAYLENYFNLQNIRNDNCKAGFLVEGGDENLLIAPLLLIPFIENAFKYVSDNKQENVIKIRIYFVNSELNFCCSNTFDVKSHPESDNMSKGIGLINVKKRLRLIYGNNYSLEAGFENKLYNVKLKLKLN